ncbi:MAG: MarR family transcriptional regulator [Coxiellaceae bacterium]|nr:MarR family transcriptional regulator [Coxiellaceae bacterium]
MTDINYSKLTHYVRFLNALWVKISSTELKKLGLVENERLILMGLVKLDMQTKSQLAESINIKPQSLSRGIDDLVKKGFIETQTVSRQIVKLRLTDKGKEVIAQLEAHNSQLWKAMTADFSREELAQLTDYLDRMIKNMK